MNTNLDKYKKDLDYLIKVGDKLNSDLIDQYKEMEGEKFEQKELSPGVLFNASYQNWYTESFQVIKQILPDRLDEFESLYKSDNKRKSVNHDTYKIQDWLKGIRSTVNDYTNQKHFNDFSIISMLFYTQLSILKSVKIRFESSLFDIKQILQADLFDSELSAAKELVKKGFLRGAGAMAGVVLEKHLEQVCLNHKIVVSKKNPAISDLNDLLKNKEVLETSNWRYIQRLGDLRNLCDHNKKREPTPEELNELIDGVDKILKTIF